MTELGDLIIIDDVVSDDVAKQERIRWFKEIMGDRLSGPAVIIISMAKKDE